MTDHIRVAGALVLLDADVLYPIRVCDFILTIASLGVIGRPVVSALILEEAARNASIDRPGPDSATRIARRFESVRSVVDGHDQPVSLRFVGSALINSKDRHVLAAALHHRVDLLITNDRRFRREVSEWIVLHGRGRRLSAAISADALAGRLVDELPSAVETAIDEMAKRFRNPPRSYAEVASGLAKSMPSLARMIRP